MHTEAVAGKKSLWIILALIALLGLDGRLFLYGYGKTALGVFALLSLGAILVIRNSNIRLTMIDRAKFIYLTAGLFFLGFFFLIQLLADTLDYPQLIPGPGLNLFENVMILSALGTWSAAVVTVLIAFFAKAKPRTKDGWRFEFGKHTISLLALAIWALLILFVGRYIG